MHPISTPTDSVQLFSTGNKEKITQKTSARDRFKGKKTVSTSFAGFVTSDVSAASLAKTIEKLRGSRRIKKLIEPIARVRDT